MRRIVKNACALALGAAALAPGARADDNPAVRTEDKPVIDYRQHVMRTLNEQSAALGQILSTVVPDDNTAAHLEAIALEASVALKSFEPKVQGGGSLPAVWTHWDDFAKRMSEFARKTAEVAQAAKSGKASKEEIMNGMTDALSCKSCHDLYRSSTD